MKLQRLIRWAIALPVILALGFTAWVTYAITKQNMTVLVSCADGENTYAVVQKFCKAYLWHFRGSAEDMKELEFNGGADYVLRGTAPFSEREALLRHLISKGLNISQKKQVNGWGFTPLHSAVLGLNEPELLLLLRLGARTDIQDDHFKRTPLELAQHLQQTRKHPEEFKRIAAILSSHQPSP
jgi:hypothetical protein